MDLVPPSLKTPHNIIYYLGVYFLLRTFFNLLSFLKPFLRPTPLNLVQRYGPNSFVLITGSSDGLGKAFAFEFASLGFNIILMARNPKKLELVRDEILKKHPKILIKIIVVDFLDSRNPGFFEKIYEELDGIDISILVNNVALDYCQEFLKTPKQDMENLMLVNMNPLVFLTYKFLPGLLERKPRYRSSIINVSSISGVLPTPYYAIYSSTKAFMEAFTETLKSEYPDKIDFLIVRPNFMSTSMNFNAEPDFETIKPEDCVKGALKDLGKSYISNGNWKHHLLNTIYMNINKKMMNWYYIKFMGRGLIERCEEGRKKIVGNGKKE